MSRLYDALQNAYSDNRHKSAPALLPAAARPRLAAPAADPDLQRLYHAIEVRLVHRPRRIIEVVACAPGEGASTVAGRLARLAAGPLERAVLLLDGAGHGAMGKPAALAAGEGGPAVAGLADEVGPAGSVLNARALRSTWDRLRPLYDLVVVDAPPVALSPLALAVAPTVDGIVLVVEAGRTRARAARDAVDAIQGAGGNLLGVVLNAPRPG